MRAVAFILGLVLSTAVLADVKTVTWTNAQQNTDGTAIPATGAGSLVRTTVEYGTCNAGKTAIASKVGEMQVAAPATTLQVSLVVVQEYCLDAWHSNTFATTFAPSTATTVVTGNSVRSGVVVTQSNPPQPNPPAGVVVGNFVAYQIVQSPNRFAVIPFGHVDPNAMCDMAHGIDTPEHGRMYIVPYDAVTLPDGSRNTQKTTVLAACG